MGEVNIDTHSLQQAHWHLGTSTGTGGGGGCGEGGGKLTDYGNVPKHRHGSKCVKTPLDCLHPSLALQYNEEIEELVKSLKQNSLLLYPIGDMRSS